MHNHAFAALAAERGWDAAFEPLPAKIRNWLYSTVQSGHNELFRTCCILRQLGIDDLEIAAQIVAARWIGYERMVEAREIEDAWTASEGATQDEQDGDYVRRPRVVRDVDAIAQALRSGVTVTTLARLSPHKDVGLPSGDVLNILFPPRTMLCLARSLPTATVDHIERWHRIAARRPWIVPSPMTNVRGKNKRGELTARSLDNTGPRRYAVIEFDWGTVDEQAAMIAAINRAYGDRLVMVMWSGGKSLHSWWWCGGDEAWAQAFFDFACSLGADPATRVRCQLVRTPNAMRDKDERQVRQQVLFLNPANIIQP
jgi:hypothetical protein